MLFWLSLILAISHLYGHDGVKDILYYQQNRLIIHQIPLESNLSKLVEAKSINYHDGSCMNCLHGYRVWELKNDSLFLKKLLNCDGKELMNKDSNNILHEEYGNNEIFASWVNGKIYNPYGILLIPHYFIYEFDREFKIKAGKLQGIAEYDNRKSRKSIYRKNADLLRKFLYENIDWKLVENQKLSDKKQVIAKFKINKAGKPTGIEIIRGINPQIDKEAERIIKLIPDWDVYYRRGKIVEIQWYLPLSFDKEFYENKIKPE